MLRSRKRWLLDGTGNVKLRHFPGKQSRIAWQWPSPVYGTRKSLMRSGLVRGRVLDAAPLKLHSRLHLLSGMLLAAVLEAWTCCFGYHLKYRLVVQWLVTLRARQKSRRGRSAASPRWVCSASFPPSTRGHTTSERVPEHTNVCKTLTGCVRQRRRLDEVCFENFPEHDKKAVHSWILQGKVLVGGTVNAKAGSLISAKESVALNVHIPKYVNRYTLISHTELPVLPLPLLFKTWLQSCSCQLDMIIS